MKYRTMLLAVPLLMGCYAKERKAAVDTISQLRTQVEQLKVVSAQKDTVMMEFNEAARFIDEVNVEISKLKKAAAPKPGPAGDIPAVSERDKRASILQRVKDINARVLLSEKSLRSTLERLDSLGKDNAAIREQLGSFEQMIASMRGVVDQQKRDLLAMADTVGTLKAETVRLNVANAVLSDTVGAFTVRENTVYYIVGTKKDLLAQGIVREEGGSRVLLVARTGKTLTPSPSLDPTKFTAIDRRKEMVISLPDPKAGYKIVSPQNPSFLETTPDKDGKFHDKLVIRDPSSFWANSKFLIVVVD